MQFLNRKIFYFLISIFVLFSAFLFFVPNIQFPDDYATTLETETGRLLSAKTSSDGQWRFAPVDSVPIIFEKSLLCFEDEYFYYHPGINLIATLKAFVRNLSVGRTKYGGSTLTQQLARMAKQRTGKSYSAKIVELFMAFKAEISYTKKDLLKMYASHAPFGGNTVGIDAASWRYFNKAPHQLSWAEAALLAVLPNNPGMIFPGKNNQKLLQKRNQLLLKLFQKKYISLSEYQENLWIELPEKPRKLPQSAFHFLETLEKQGFRGKRIRVFIDEKLQEKTQSYVNESISILKLNHIHNLAITIIDVETEKIVSYVGNTSTANMIGEGSAIDMVQASRSYGSLLKPFLYALALEKGIITPKQLLPDVPIAYRGFVPQNFSQEFNGLVNADKALRLSLNIPAVQLLEKVGVESFLSFMKTAGMNELKKQADFYGLSLILGGGETNLLSICQVYAALYKRIYSDTIFNLKISNINNGKDYDFRKINKAVAYQTYAACLPNNEEYLDAFRINDFRNYVSFKTGTSYGFRDAWSVGFNGKYLVGVWAGNASGEGRPGLTGSNVAVPVMYRIFEFLPIGKKIQSPSEGFITDKVCSESGMKASEICDKIHFEKIPLTCNNQNNICTFHQKLQLDKSKKFRVNSDCYPIENTIDSVFFVIPSKAKYYYEKQNMRNFSLPPLMQNCKSFITKELEIIYPPEGGRIWLGLGNKENVIAEAAVNKNNETVYWYLNQQYIGQTKQFHKIKLNPKKGKNVLWINNNNGLSDEIYFELLQPEKK
jgi:penicillin-binding protein 1C